MSQQIRMSDFAALSSEEREAAIRKIGEAGMAPVNGYPLSVASRIRAFEARYETTSTQLLEDLRLGTRKETAEVSQWLYLLRVEELLRAR